MANKKNISKGDMLISLPSGNLIDLSFSRSLILLADHEELGSVGFVLNKPIEVTLSDLIPTTNAQYTIYEGGPVEQDKIFCIHKRPDIIPNSLHINDELYWGGDFDTILNLVNTGVLSKDDIRFYLGYTGWDIDQLENEIEDNYWITIDKFEYDLLLTIPSKQVWKKAIKSLGQDYTIWLNAPENPNFN